MTRSFEEWETLLVDAGIPIGAINNISQVIDHPQVAARGSIVNMDHPRAGAVRVVGVPIRLSETPGSVRTPSPSLGEHTETVLSEILGMTQGDIDALRAAGGLGK
jgi:crotonobetainyl-CoA:carnitine CoA-transferase CaiB-like acyl-CoA transferase